MTERGGDDDRAGGWWWWQSRGWWWWQSRGMMTEQGRDDNRAVLSGIVLSALTIYTVCWKPRWVPQVHKRGRKLPRSPSVICFPTSNNRVFVHPTVQGSARRKELFSFFFCSILRPVNGLWGLVEALASFRRCGQHLPSPLQCAKATHSLPTFQREDTSPLYTAIQTTIPGGNFQIPLHLLQELI